MSLDVRMRTPYAPELELPPVFRPVSLREIGVAAALALALGSVYLSQRAIGPQFSTALAVLIAGQALIAIVDDVFPHARRHPESGELDQPSAPQEERRK